MYMNPLTKYVTSKKGKRIGTNNKLLGTAFIMLKKPASVAKHNLMIYILR